MDYEVIDYDDTVNVKSIVQMILDGWEVMPHTNDPLLDWVVYVYRD